MFTICAICPADHLKAKKIGVVSSLFAILRFLLYLKFGPTNIGEEKHEVNLFQSSMCTPKPRHIRDCKKF